MQIVEQDHRATARCRDVLDEPHHTFEREQAELRVGELRAR